MTEQDAKVNVNHRLPEAVVADVDALAAAEYRSRSAMIAVLLVEAITARGKQNSEESVALAIEKYRAIFGTPGQYDGRIYTDDLPKWAYDFLGFDVCNLVVKVERLQAQLAGLLGLFTYESPQGHRITALRNDEDVQDLIDDVMAGR